MRRVGRNQRPRDDNRSVGDVRGDDAESERLRLERRRAAATERVQKGGRPSITPRQRLLDEAHDDRGKPPLAPEVRWEGAEGRGEG